MYIFTFIQKTSSNSKSSNCSELDSEIILSECRIVGALEGTRLELGVRLVTLQPIVSTRSRGPVILMISRLQYVQTADSNVLLIMFALPHVCGHGDLFR